MKLHLSRKIGNMRGKMIDSYLNLGKTKKLQIPDYDINCQPLPLEALGK